MLVYDHSDSVLGLRFRVSELVMCMCELAYELMCMHVHRHAHVGACGGQRLTS